MDKGRDALLRLASPRTNNNFDQLIYAALVLNSLLSCNERTSFNSILTLYFDGIRIIYVAHVCLFVCLFVRLCGVCAMCVHISSHVNECKCFAISRRDTVALIAFSMCHHHLFHFSSTSMHTRTHSENNIVYIQTFCRLFTAHNCNKYIYDK